MLRTTLAAAAAAILTVPAASLPAAAQHGLQPGQLLNYTGQIRAQMALVRAQTDATFEPCRSGRLISDDIYDELDGLCRELDRLEAAVSQPILTRNQLRRIDRALHRLDDQACDVEDAVRTALADPRRHRDSYFAPTVQTVGYRGFTTHTVGHRGFRLMIGGGKVGVTVGVANPTPTIVAKPALVGFHRAGDPDGDALCAVTDNLRLMTRQLLILMHH